MKLGSIIVYVDGNEKRPRFKDHGSTYGGTSRAMLLKPDETFDTKRYPQQLMHLSHSLLEKRPETTERQDQVIL